MVIKVTGVAKATYDYYPQQEQTKTKFYEPQQNKEVVKEDFGIVLDREMDKLHFDKVI